MASATAGPQPASAGLAANEEAPADRSFPQEPCVGIGAVVLRWAPPPATGKEVNAAKCLMSSKPHSSALQNCRNAEPNAAVVRCFRSQQVCTLGHAFMRRARSRDAES